MNNIPTIEELNKLISNAYISFLERVSKEIRERASKGEKVGLFVGGQFFEKVKENLEPMGYKVSRVGDTDLILIGW